MKILNKRRLPEGLIINKIYFIRGQKVMLDYDLAELYQVETRILNRNVKRNLKRFPVDFMFQLSREENRVLTSQIGISKEGRGGRTRTSFVFTEQGVAMLSTVLNSERAIKVNIQIMRTFTKLRAMLSSHQELREKLQQLEKKYDSQFQIVFRAIQRLITEEEKPKKKIGFRTK